MIAAHGPQITLEALSDMPVLHRNIQEAIRLFPPLIILLRYVHKEFAVTTSKGETYSIPRVCSDHFHLNVLIHYACKGSKQYGYAESHHPAFHKSLCIFGWLVHVADYMRSSSGQHCYLIFGGLW